MNKINVVCLINAEKNNNIKNNDIEKKNGKITS